jgi:hypothetical protein
MFGEFTSSILSRAHWPGGTRISQFALSLVGAASSWMDFLRSLLHHACLWSTLLKLPMLFVTYCSLPTARYLLDNIIEQDHRFVKKRIVASQWFRSVQGAVNTIQGYEAMHMIRKGQIRWLQKGDIAGQVRFVNRAFGLAA